MAKIACKCGHIINLIIHPSPDEFKIISSETMDSLHEQSVLENVFDVIRLENDDMYKCPACSRLIIFWKQNNNLPSLYKPESFD
ncbi:MAG: hypothetical protein JWN25_3177 [Verrucomicrobiales bacterium]|nr:hypothetical protein [Verrucomicrobiales bacterium]